MAASSALMHFNPRSPHGERRSLPLPPRSPADFNPRSPHGERPILPRTTARSEYFNPRSPHGERQPCQRWFRLVRDFNPRSPHGERRIGNCVCNVIGVISTHAPRTGSDVQAEWCILRACDFNPRSPHGERPSNCAMVSFMFTFQPTLPARGATTDPNDYIVRSNIISTHAPRTGSDRAHPAGRADR